MMKFLSTVWNLITATKNAVGNLLFLIIVILISTVIFSSDKPDFPDQAALILNPTGLIVDQKRPVDPMSVFLSGGDIAESETLLRDVIDTIKSAESDNRIKVMVLSLDRLQGVSPSKLSEIGTAISSFKSAGKPVLAYGSAFGQSQYYLASFADELYLDSASMPFVSGVFLPGYGVYPTFFAAALEKLKISMHVYKVGIYKSAIEPYIRSDMSPEAADAASHWLGTLWSEYRDTIVANRKINSDDFDTFTNELDDILIEYGNDPIEAVVSRGLVDGAISRKEWMAKVNQVVTGSPAFDPSKGYPSIAFKDYLNATTSPLPSQNSNQSKVAVIVAKGTIVDGESPPGDIGSDSLSRLIRKARLDDSVKALVLRVDSPGGSASAAEKIRAELAALQADGKPLVVSMSSYAASGGYWISANANRIYALPTTVTGSIGAYALFPGVKEGLAEIGIASDGRGTTALSSANDFMGELNPVFDRALQSSIRHVYQKFISLVAEGRGMNLETVDEIAQGRVWPGSTALELGLVDALGDLDDAIGAAASLAGIDNLVPYYIEPEMSARDQFLMELSRSEAGTWFTGLLPTGLGSLLQKANDSDFIVLLRQLDNAQIISRCEQCDVKW